ncbi:MAG: hypothetical protein WAU96_04165, partial [Anaerolineae bacterium]
VFMLVLLGGGIVYSVKLFGLSPRRVYPYLPELINTNWDLEHLLVNGEMQPPYHPNQCVHFSENGLMDFSDGCNDTRCSIITDTETKICSQTLVSCSTEIVRSDGYSEAHSWGAEFEESLGAYKQAEIKSGYLYWYTSYVTPTTLVFRSRGNLVCP